MQLLYDIALYPTRGYIRKCISTIRYYASVLTALHLPFWNQFPRTINIKRHIHVNHCRLWNVFPLWERYFAKPREDAKLLYERIRRGIFTLKIILVPGKQLFVSRVKLLGRNPMLLKAKYIICFRKVGIISTRVIIQRNCCWKSRNSFLYLKTFKRQIMIILKFYNVHSHFYQKEQLCDTHFSFCFLSFSLQKERKSFSAKSAVLLDRLTSNDKRWTCVSAWFLGWFMCKAVAYIQGVSVAASVYSLVAVSLDRYVLHVHWTFQRMISSMFADARLTFDIQRMVTVKVVLIFPFYPRTFINSLSRKK